MENGSVAYLHKNHAHGDDAYLTRMISLNSVLDGVFDGVSSANGKKASRLTVEKLKNGRIESPKYVGDLLQEANDELYRPFSTLPLLHRPTTADSLTTATAALKIGNKLYLFNVGDSPAYLIRNGGAIELAELDRDDEGYLTNCVGFGRRFKFHTKQIELHPNDKLVLITDGISDNISLEGIVGISKETTSQEAIKKLKSLFDKKKSSKDFKDDDATAIIRYFQ